MLLQVGLPLADAAGAGVLPGESVIDAPRVGQLRERADESLLGARREDEGERVTAAYRSGVAADAGR